MVYEHHDTAALTEDLEHLKVVVSSSLVDKKDSERRTSLSTRFVDFWLLGGASLVLWLIMWAAYPLRRSSEAVDGHFAQIMTLASVMSIFCNHPHFMISYKFGYGRGPGFIARHWFKLVAVPLGLIAFYIVGYIHFNQDISNSAFVLPRTASSKRLGSRFDWVH